MKTATGCFAGRFHRTVQIAFLRLFPIACTVLALSITSPLLADPPAADPPETIKLSGIVRDFKRAHPDFNMTSPADRRLRCQT